MDHVELVDRHFQDLIQRDESTWNDVDRTIYWIIATRCEMDMNGFDSVFNQLLSKTNLQLLIRSLADLDETKLSQCFQRAQQRLDSVGFFDDDQMMLWDLTDQLTEVEFLADIEDQIRENDRLWELDDKLAALISQQAK